MILSKGKKLILVAAAVLLLLVSGFFAWNSYRETSSTVEYALRGLFDKFAYWSPYKEKNSKHYAYYMDNLFLVVKDNKMFKKELIAIMNEYRTGCLDDDTSHDRYGELISQTNAYRQFARVTAFFSEVGYENEAWRDGLRGFYAENVQNYLDNIDPDAVFDTSSAIDQAAKYLQQINAAASEFYNIPLDEIFDADEVAGYYEKVVEKSIRAEDWPLLAKALNQAAVSPLVGERTFLSEEEVVDLLVSGNEEIVTLVNEPGSFFGRIAAGYVDPIAAGIFGDFYYREIRSGGNKYDTSAFTPELWAALSPDQRDEIMSGNKQTVTVKCFFRTQDSSEDIPALVEEGYRYGYLLSDGGFLFVAEDRISYKNTVFFGDYADLVKQLEEQYPKQNALNPLAQNPQFSGNLDDIELYLEEWRLAEQATLEADHETLTEEGMA